jgi:phosphate transport system substrate-binding protein
MPQAYIRNLKGNYIAPSLETISAAAQGEIPRDTRITLTNSDSDNGYPIAGFTWLLVYKEQNYNSRTLAKAQELVNMIKWMLTDGQKYAEPLDYAPLSSGAAQKALAQLSTVVYNGERLLK